jgi:NAD(P)-dependent dehydrogenase (short-subunit alcohol dehydrogenase family)
MPSHETAIVFGVGPGLGWALARRFVSANMEVAAVARDKAKLNSPIQSEGSHDIRAYAAEPLKWR